MVAETIEDRLTTAENELAQIKRRLTAEKPHAATAGWEKMFGIFIDSEGFEEAVRFGREYREAQNAEPLKRSMAEGTSR